MAEQPKAAKTTKTAGGQPRKQVSGGKPAAVASSMAISDGREIPHPTPRLKKHYKERLVPDFMRQKGLKNEFQVPRLSKVVVNVGVSRARENAQVLDSVREELAMISGQWPQVRRAKKSISNFKLREGMPIGLRVTLRGDRMWEFLDRMIAAAIPRIRDFRGLNPAGFDGHGNYNLGLREQTIFPSVNAEKSLGQQGMNITVVTTAGKDERGFELLAALGFPFRKIDVRPKKGSVSPREAAVAQPAAAKEKR